MRKINNGLDAIRTQAREAEQLALKLIDEKDRRDKLSNVVAFIEQHYMKNFALLEERFNALQDQLSSREDHKDKHERIVEEDKDLVYKR